MKPKWFTLMFCAAITIVITASTAGAQQIIIGSGDTSNEVPIYGLPKGMTFTEYEDANRRTRLGHYFLSIPVPGMLHFHAGERRAGWKHVGARLGGILLIITGGSMLDEKDTWRDSDYEVMDITGDNGDVRRYEKIPITEEGGAVEYRLRLLPHESEGGLGGLLVFAGVGVVVGEIIHDWVAGTRLINKKRNEVRFKYGKTMNLSMGFAPKVDFENGILGAGVSLQF